MFIRFAALLLASSAVAAAPSTAQSTITERSVSAHQTFLASDALQGRGSATRDEAIAAAYVASQFQSYGLVPAPGMDGYLQQATVIRTRLDGAPSMTVGGTPIAAPTLILASGNAVSGPLTIISSADPAKLPSAPVVLVTDPAADARALFGAAARKKVKLLLLPETEASRGLLGMVGGQARLPTYLEGKAPEGEVTLALVPASALALMASKPEAAVELKVPVKLEKAITTNAIGYLKGSDAKAGTILLSAHLDHLGVRADGTIMHGANDDASGTTAVMELAKTLAAGKKPRRSIIFAAFGSEELGGFGSTFFAEHPPVPLTQIVANLSFEMIGAQDPKLPKNNLMMTGFERSTLGPALKKQGGLVARDPYPEQRFFERSDNYSLALKGVVAHTVSGWAVVPTYHKPDDTNAKLDIPFMTAAIRSLVAPMRWLANSRFVPSWTPGGKPEKR
ncbi:MAG TPA: M28 family peptidase [Sphingomicrobium sp.]|jgi:hypothetical protein